MEDFVTASISMINNSQPPESLISEGIQFVETSCTIKLSPFDIVSQGRVKIWVDTDKGTAYAGSVALKCLDAVEQGIAPEAVSLLASFFKAVEVKHPKSAPGLAKSIIDFIAAHQQGAGIGSIEENKDLIIGIKPGEIRVFFADPRPRSPKMSLRVIPESANAIISECDRFGFSIKHDLVDIEELTYKIENS
jgi:hypothetical protein